MKYIKNIWNWCLEHLSYVQAILILSVTVISTISETVKQPTVTLVALLIFVGTEFTVITIGYLEPVSKKLNLSIKEKKKISELIINDSLLWKDLADQAKRDIFLSGVTLGSLYQDRRKLNSIPDNINIYLLVHDINNDNATKLYCEVCKPKASFQDLKDKQVIFRSLANDLRLKKNIFIKMTEEPLYIQFVGNDVFNESEKSYIRAQHCLRKKIVKGDDKIIDDKLIFGADGQCELFRIYKKQIQILWADAKDYTCNDIQERNK